MKTAAFRAAVFVCRADRAASRVIAAAIVSAAEIAVVVGYVHIAVVVVVVVVVLIVVVVVPVVRRLVGEALAGTVVAVAVGADVVETGIARERAAGLVAAAPGTSTSAAVAERVGVAEGLLVRSAHHAADAGEQQRAADDAGRGCRRGAEERAAATAHRRSAIALTRSLTGTLTWALA